MKKKQNKKTTKKNKKTKKTKKTKKNKWESSQAPPPRGVSWVILTGLCIHFCDP
jgi:hypothetical protein